MPRSRSRWLRHAVVLALVVAVVGVVRPLSADAQSDSRSSRAAVDHSIGARSCGLLGRVWSASGCQRRKCVEAAVPLKQSPGAEVCRLRGGAPFATVVESRTCTALHRRWIAAADWCASNSRRTKAVIEHAAQCTAPHTTYVTLLETEGYYDLCLRPSEARQVRRDARRHGVSVPREAADQSEVLCAQRPGRQYVNGRCVLSDGTILPEQAGGTVVIGDSVTWRAADELAGLRDDFTVDGMPARRLDQLDRRLNAYRRLHGQPDGLIVALGANPAHGYANGNMMSTLAGIPATTQVMFVLPYRSVKTHPRTARAPDKSYARWMTHIARSRPHTCVANWRGLVRTHPWLLVDGVHPTSSGERSWARFVAASWKAC